MAEDSKKEKRSERSEKSEKPEMTLAEAKAYRASLNKPKAQSQLSEQEKREAFRLFWAQEKYKFGKAKDLEEIVWLHLKSSKLDQPEQFEAGLDHFGLKKIR